MKKNYSTKRALIASILALALCCTMFIGTTFAWFTDEVSNTGNVVKTGNLKVNFFWKDGAEDPTADAGWNDAASGAMFDYQLWEPGYTVARHIKVVNAGNLALNYKMRIVPNGVVSDLADVIDVYYFAEDKAMDRADLANATRLGTLAEVMGTEKHLSKTVYGSLEPTDAPDIHTIVLKMQESAGNEYKNMDLGCTFSVQIIASQMSSEEDSFDNHYDDPFNYDSTTGDKGDVPDPSTPVALVRPLDNLNITTINSENIILSSGYQFLPTISGALDENHDPKGDVSNPNNGDVANNIYKHWHADFNVYADNDIPADTIILAGYYAAFGNWVALSNDGLDIAAGQEVRLVKDALGQAGFSGVCLTYKDICDWGNDGVGFLCGLAPVDYEAAKRLEGTTVTVELTVYKTNSGDIDSTHTCGETGDEKLVVGTFTYTFPEAYRDVATADELKAALDNAVDGDRIRLVDNIDMGATALTVADDITLDLNGKTLSGVCNSGSAHLITVKNGATLNVYDKSAAADGKITYAAGSSNVGWTICLEGALNLYSGTLELTGDWSIGYAVDARPNAWGTAYTEPTVFTMYGGKIVSSDGAIRVASSSSETYTGISSSFVMEGGVIEAAWDGIFVQQSNTIYDVLNVTVNNGVIKSSLSPIRVYAPVATSVVNGSAKPITITANADSLVMDGAADLTRTWVEEGKILLGGGISVADFEQYTTLTLN